MSFHVKDDFRDGMPFAAVGVEWYNRVAGFLNALVGGLGIKVFKPSRPAVGAPVFIDIDPMAGRDGVQGLRDAERGGFRRVGWTRPQRAPGHRVDAGRC